MDGTVTKAPTSAPPTNRRVKMGQAKARTFEQRKVAIARNEALAAEKKQCGLRKETHFGIARESPDEVAARQQKPTRCDLAGMIAASAAG